MNFFDDVIKDIGKDTAKLSKNLEESHSFLFVQINPFFLECIKSELIRLSLQFMAFAQLLNNSYTGS